MKLIHSFAVAREFARRWHGAPSNWAAIALSPARPRPAPPRPSGGAWSRGPVLGSAQWGVPLRPARSIDPLPRERQRGCSGRQRERGSRWVAPGVAARPWGSRRSTLRPRRCGPGPRPRPRPPRRGKSRGGPSRPPPSRRVPRPEAPDQMVSEHRRRADAAGAMPGQGRRSFPFLFVEPSSRRLLARSRCRAAPIRSAEPPPEAACPSAVGVAPRSAPAEPSPFLSDLESSVQSGDEDEP